MAWSKDREAHRGYAELCISKTDDERRNLPDNAAPEDYFRSVGYMRFPKIEDAAVETYELMKDRNQKQMLTEMREETERMSESRYRRDKKSVAALISYLVETEGMSYQEVADIAGMPYSTVKGIAWRERNRRPEDD